MENIVANLHLDLTALLWHSANFLVLVGILWALFFRPFARVIEQRQQRIHESLARADQIDRLDSTAEAYRQALIAEANKEAADIRRRAHDQVERYVLRSRAQANADANRIRERATEYRAAHGAAQPSRQPVEVSDQRHRARALAARSARGHSLQEHAPSIDLTHDAAAAKVLNNTESANAQR